MIEEIEHHIKNARIEEALQLGLEWSIEINNKDLGNSIILLKYQYERLQNQNRTRTISAENYIVESTKICEALLDFIKPKPSIPVIEFTKYITLFVALMIIAIVILIPDCPIQCQKLKPGLPIIDTSNIDSAKTIDSIVLPLPKLVLVPPDFRIDTSIVKMSNTLVESIENIEILQLNNVPPKIFEIQFSYSPELRPKEAETYNYDGGHLALIINTKKYPLNYITIKNFEHPNGYSKYVIENYIFQKIEQALKNNRNEQIFFTFLENHTRQ